jgi:hypothetical protein
MKQKKMAGFKFLVLHDDFSNDVDLFEMLHRVGRNALG